MTALFVLAAIGSPCRSARGAAAALVAASDQRSTDQRPTDDPSSGGGLGNRGGARGRRRARRRPRDVAVAVATARLIPRLEPAGARRRRRDRAAELPLTLDLLGVCLRAGMPLVAALETVADALPGPFSDDLRVVAGLQRLGAAPADRLGRTRLRSRTLRRSVAR